MGGYGSGRSYSGRDTTSSYRQIDVRRWHRSGLLESGHFFSSQWSHGGAVVASISARTETGCVMLSYNHCKNGGVWQSEEYPVWLEWTRCNYGGRRPWFLCPARGCGRRVAILYGGSIFACRQCYGLAYDSQREPPHDRALRRAQAIQVKLGGLPGMANAFPPKPKGMHWLTYQRLRAESEQAADRFLPPRILRMLQG